MGWDAISNKILKPVSASLAPSLTNLLNTVFKVGSRWVIMEEGSLDPSFKKEDRADYANYRPITVLNVVAKCLNHYSANKSQREWIPVYMINCPLTGKCTAARPS